MVGDGPILFAVASSAQPLETRQEMLDVLLKHGVDINTVAGNQRTVMDIAVYYDEAPLCDLLREYGVHYGPREMAVFNRLAELKEAVVNNPELIHERFKSIYAGQDLTLLGLALKHGHREVAHFLIDSGAPLDTLEEHGLTPMFMAARGGTPEFVRLLAARGLDVNARDDWNDTPLTDSILRTNVETVKALLEVGADVNARAARGRTALSTILLYWHVDATARSEERRGRTALSAKLLYGRHEQLEIIRLLIAAGADPTIADNEGHSALDIARDYPPEVQELLGIPTAPAAKVE